METKFTAGELGKIFNLSKQTLIYYDNINLFKPKIVNHENGYRYYTPEQFEVLNAILILKETGVCLNDIKSFLKTRNAEQAMQLFEKQKQILDEKIKEYKRISARLNKKIITLNDVSKNTGTAFFKRQEKEYMFYEKVKKPYGFTDVDLAYKQLLKKIKETNAHYEYILGATIPLENINNGEFKKSDKAFVPLENKINHPLVFSKKAGIYAIAYHVGSYSSIDKTYNLLLKKIYENGYEPKSSSYEYCILDSLTSKTTEDYVTQICILV